MIYWNYTLLFAGCFLLVFTNDSQLRFLALVLVLTAVLGLSLLEHDLWVVLGVRYIGFAVYFVLNFLALVLSPAQILLLFILKPQSKPKTGIVVHHPEDEKDKKAVTVDIVAVHGLGSNPDWAWEHEGTGVMWLKDLLPKEIPNARIMTFNHNSKWDIDASVKSVESCGQELLDTLNLHREDEKRPIIFIGHSFGGIIIKKALVIAGQANTDPRYQALKDSTIGIVFLGVPHDGSTLTTAGKLISYGTYWLGSSAELLEALEPGAKLLKELNNSFLSAYSSHKLVNFYERRKTKMWGIPLLLAVDENSGSFSGKTKIGLEANHVGVNKFESKEDNNYMLVRREIEKIARSIKGYSEDDAKGCLKTLFFEEMDSRQEGISEREKSTFNWVWNYGRFANWREKDQSVFWVFGKPGSGKSTFSKYILKTLCKDPRGPATAIVGFFFNDRGGELAKSSRGFLQALLHQIISQIPALSIHIAPEYKARKEKFGEKFEWPLQALLQALLSLLADPIIESVYIFIDAADECEEKSRRELFDYIVKLCAWPNSRLKVFVTSRYEPWLLRANDTIKTQTANLHTIKLEQMTDGDMRNYVKSQVERLPEYCRKFLEVELLERAQGVFLWVGLVVYDLEDKAIGGTISEIRESLKSIPTELDALYSRLLNKLRPENHDMAKRMLQWVLLAERPLTLEEFRYAIAVGQNKFSSHKELEGSESVEKPTETESRVRSRSGGLLEVVRTGNRQIVQLIHQSAREFLRGGMSLNNTGFKIVPSEGHSHLAIVCVSYLQFSEFQDYSEDQVRPLQEYAGSYWVKHAHAAGESEALDPEPIKGFMWSKYGWLIRGKCFGL